MKEKLYQYLSSTMLGVSTNGTSLGLHNHSVTYVIYAHFSDKETMEWRCQLPQDTDDTRSAESSTAGWPDLSLMMSCLPFEHSNFLFQVAHS